VQTGLQADARIVRRLRTDDGDRQARGDGTHTDDSLH
jgi:hypothetical protein